jgi:hypothetical protein
MDVTTIEDMEAGYTVEDLYMSVPDPVNQEDGFVLSIARHTSGHVQYAFTDHRLGILLDIPDDVAVFFAHTLIGYTPTPGQDTDLLLVSRTVPAMENGYIISYHNIPGDEGLLIQDEEAGEKLKLPLPIALEFARAVIASKPFPASRLN